MTLLDISEDDRVFVRTQLKLSEDDIKRDVKILKEWLRKQPHLPQEVQDDSFFESFLIRSKGRVERVKERIDMYYTIKTTWPEVFNRLQDVRLSKLSIDYFPILKLTNEKNRLFFARFNKNSAETHNTLEGLKTLVAELEIMNKHDYSSGLVIVIDMSNFQMDMMKLITPSVLQKCNIALTEVYTNIIVGVHIYKPPSWIGLFLNLSKQIVKAKIIEKIALHDDFDSLNKIIPKELLPSDFGGELPPVKKLKEQWDEIIINQKEYLEEVEQLKSDEQLRVGKSKIDTHMFGVEGTFKKLNLD